MAVNKLVKRRGKRAGPTHRLWVTLAQPTYEALRDQSVKLGYSIGALTRLTIDRAVAAGLLNAEKPSETGAVIIGVTQSEQYYRLSEKLLRLQEDHIKILQDRIALKDQMLAQMQQGLEEYAETITQQAKEIEWKETKARLTKRLES